METITFKYKVQQWVEMGSLKPHMWLRFTDDIDIQ